MIPDIYCDPRVPLSLPAHVRQESGDGSDPQMDLIGAIGNYWASQRHPPRKRFHCFALADSTSIALENVNVYAELEDRVRDRTAELEKAHEEVRALSVTDELTGLNNRRGFYPLAEAALHAARRHNRSCLLAFLDIDGPSGSTTSRARRG